MDDPLGQFASDKLQKILIDITKIRRQLDRISKKTCSKEKKKKIMKQISDIRERSRLFGDRVIQFKLLELLDVCEYRLNSYVQEIGMVENDSVLKEIFLYKKFSNSYEAKQILKILDMDVCPYCNRAFTITVEKGKMNGSGKGIRPEFDHYFPRKYYPYLAVNLYNLIPSCGICNKFKSYHDTYKEPILYPYDEGLGNEYVFMSYPQNGSMLYLKKFMSQEDFRLRIEPVMIYSRNRNNT